MIDGNFCSAVMDAAITRVLVVATIIMLVIVAVAFTAGYYLGQTAAPSVQNDD